MEGKAGTIDDRTARRFVAILRRQYLSTGPTVLCGVEHTPPGTQPRDQCDTGNRGHGGNGDTEASLHPQTRSVRCPWRTSNREHAWVPAAIACGGAAKSAEPGALASERRTSIVGAR